MSLLNHPRRIWLDVAVGSILISILIIGSLYIYQLNNDARELQLNNALAMRGQTLSIEQGCVACHTMDGSLGIGPSWQGMFGRTETLLSGKTIVVDEDYFRESVKDPSRKVVQGFPNVMLPYFLEEDEIVALVEFAKQLAVPVIE